jgi:thiol-disulfide isomerase/thioredoxin
MPSRRQRLGQESAQPILGGGWGLPIGWGGAPRLRLATLLAIGGVVLTSGVALADDGSKSAQASAKAPAPSLGLPWLGVSMDNGSDLGVRIEHVVRGSPAERGGVRVGDRIVTIDGTRVTAPGHVSRNVATRRVGETVTLGLERTGNAINASVVLAARPSSDDLVKMHLVGAPAPAWSNVSALSGAPTSVASLKGKVALIDFWASWCGPCRMIAPRLGALSDRLGPQGFTVVGVTTDEPEQANGFIEKHQMRYPSVVDTDGSTSRSYGIVGLPTMVLIDKKGVVRDVFVGFDPSGEAKLEAAVKKLLAEAR